MKKLLCFALALVMVFALFTLAACKSETGDTSGTSSNAGTESTSGGDSSDILVTPFPEGTYTYKDAVSKLASNWNPHTYETNDDEYPRQYLRVGLYDFFYNDALHPIEGKEAYTGYVIVPEMAASDPVDVTEQIKEEHPEFNIPDSATKGYAYTIDLNQSATWQDGTKIDADTYVYSMQQLLNPDLKNYRATDYYSGNFCIAGAEFYANQGQTKTIAPNTVIANDGLADLDAFLEKYGDEIAYVDWEYSFGEVYDYDTKTWGDLPDDYTSGAQKTKFTISEMKDIFIDAVVNRWGYDEATALEFFAAEASVDWIYPSDIDYSTVGCFKSGEYQITLVFGKSLSGFYLYYALTNNWIVYEDLYESCLEQKGDAWFSTYNTSVETTMSYGPYKLVSYQTDKNMRFEKNDAWYGYTDGKHIYTDPEDGLTYNMYQTTAVDCQVVEEAATQKSMFLKGELMTYGLQADDFEEYRNSDRTYVTPEATIYFLIVNGNETAIKNREAASDFDTSKYDLETLLLTSFRQALAVTYDKELFASTVSPARSGGYGLIGTAYISDPETGTRYRDTDQAKKTLLNFYGIDLDDYNGDLDAAVAAISGYDPVLAKELFTKAFEEAISRGYITDADNDGKSDQTIEIEYCASVVNSFIELTIGYLNEKLADVIKDTPFEGKVLFKVSAPYGDEWVAKIKGGLSDVVLGGWSGSELDPFSVTDVYVNPTYQYNAQWFDASSVQIELELNTAGIGETEKRETLTGSLRNWSDALNGATVKFSNGNEYCFGDGIVDYETRLEILAAIEGAILSTYDYIPMLQNASMQLVSKQIFYVVDEYNPIMSRGGIAYLKYEYNDAEWAEYVASQDGGVLKY